MGKSISETDSRRIRGEMLEVSLCACAGLLPLALGVRGSLGMIAWWALLAPSLGIWCGARGLSAWPFAVLLPASWMLVLPFTNTTEFILPDPAWGIVALTGLFATGLGIGRFARRPATAFGASFALIAILAGLPFISAPLARQSPAWAARVFDASVVTFAMECAGVDWSRHRAIYDAAGTEWFSDRRAPYRGKLAGPVALLLGCASWTLGRRRVRDLRQAALGLAATGGSTAVGDRESSAQWES